MKKANGVKTMAVVIAVAAVAIVMTSCGPAFVIDGTWSGVIMPTYVCEGTPYAIQIEILENTVTITSSDNIYEFPEGLTGTLEPLTTAKIENRFAVTFDNDGPQYAMLVFDAEAGHAAFAVDANAYDPENYSRYGYLGVLQLGEAQTTTFALSDLVGDWTGVSARADDTFTVTSTSASTASITGTQTLSMTGEFGEGSFSVTDGGIFLGDGSSGVYETGYNAQTGYDYSVSMPNQDAYGAIYVLSPDKNYLAVAFLDDLCDPSLLFRLPDQLFSLWVRQ